MPLGRHLRALSIESISIRVVLEKINLKILCIVDWNGEQIGMEKRFKRLQAVAEIQVKENEIKL